MLADVLDVKSRAKVAYDQMEHPWPPGDNWSMHTKRSIGAFVRAVMPDTEAFVLNAGSGGNDYGLSRRMTCVNLDISLRQCRTLKLPVLGDVERLPFVDSQFDATICVGAVINYVHPETAIPELVRVTKPGGLILVDFESSYSAEIMFAAQWRKPLTVIERMYVDHMDKTFLYSPPYIRGLFETAQASVIAARGYHIASAMWERIFTKALIPRAAYSLDRLASRVPGVRSLASSVLFACRKTEAPN
jgi:SAM-dependent methyltransferase